MGGSERTPAQSAKDLGSELYANGDYAAAENAFTEALSLATQVDRSELHIFHSNRCAARMQLANVDGALQDAKKCTELAPRWAKGWSRLGACQAQKGRYSAAEASFRTALSLDPGNETYRAQLSNARAQMRPPESPGGGRGEPPRRSWADRARPTGLPPGPSPEPPPCSAGGRASRATSGGCSQRGPPWQCSSWRMKSTTASSGSELRPTPSLPPIPP
uniref:Carboxylate clamp-tetratricopeptide repeat protein n=1 Tax=Tetraselmis sp. GSL018 TaxID=582737 RepID=A0A061SC12_9CHLO